MQGIFFSLSGLSFLVCLLLLLLKKKSRAFLKNKKIISAVVSPKFFNLYATIFKSASHTVFSFNSNVFVLNKNNKNIVWFDVFVEKSQMVEKTSISTHEICFGLKSQNNNAELFVKHNCMEVLCNMHSTIKLCVFKNKLPYSINAKNNVLKFEDFKFLFKTDGKIKSNSSADKIEIIAENATSLSVDFSSLNLNRISVSETKQIIRQNFSMPVLDFAKPDFSNLEVNSPQTRYAKKCQEEAKCVVTKMPIENRINLSALGFSCWVKCLKRKNKIQILDWKTNLKIEIVTNQNFFISVWWGQVFLCLDGEDFSVNFINFQKLKNGKINPFNLKLNTHFLPPNMQFLLAYSMLKYMNKTENSKWLKDKNVAKFIFSQMPKSFQESKKHYMFVRQIFPYVINKPLQNKMLLFMQSYEQKFYKLKKV